ncbi:hypothetical protein K0M31_012746, partial [Melipona bicolor]
TSSGKYDKTILEARGAKLHCHCVAGEREEKARHFSTRWNTRDGVQEQREESDGEVRKESKEQPEQPESPRESRKSVGRRMPRQAKTALLSEEETKEKEKEERKGGEK